MWKLNNNVYITFDVDWVCDEILAYTLDIVEREAVKATFFITHDTPLLERMRSNPNIELGIHPNFHKLLADKHTEENAETILRQCLNIVPEARSIRTHCLVQSSYLFNLYKKYGLTHEVSLLLPIHSGNDLQPFLYCNGLIRIPYHWEDDFHCINIANGLETNWRIEPFLDNKNIKVFDFHPIHLFLNTERLERYENSRNYHRNAIELVQYINKDVNNGSLGFFKNLIIGIKKRSLEFSLIRNINQ